MEPKTEEDEFAAERERIEERHRVEVLNLLRSFEFERKDTEARLRAEMENKENESLKPGQSGILDTGAFLHEIDDLDNKLDRENGEDKELRKRFEQEKEDFLRRIRQLEEEVVSKRQIDYAGVDKKDFEFDGVVAEDVGSASEVEGEEVSSEKHETNTPISTKNTVGNQEPPTEDNAPISSNGLVKSLTELEEENNELKEELDHQRDQVHKLQNQVQVLNRKLDNVRQVLGDQEAFAADKQEKIREIIENDLTESAGGKTETKDGHALGDGTTGSPDFQGNRSSSVMSFQIEELNVENEELKSNVHKLEQKIQRTIEEYEIQRSVFKEKLDLILQSLSESQLPDQDSRGSENAKNIAEDIVDQMKNLMLKGTSEELLEEYVNIILGHQSASKSPDVFDINLHHEIQSLEHLLDIEIFDGRVFDDEMKDEVRQVLRDKERELIVAYAVEKLRVEIRHRLTTQSTLEELRKEREKEFMVYHKTNEFLKEHLGIASSAESGTKDVKDALMKDFKEESKSQGGRNEDGINPADVETLKAEKEELESALQELQDHFQKERQDWLSKLESPLHDDSDQDEKEKAVHRLRAQMVIMEQVLNTERFNLGRLYYSEMKEELEASLKQHQFERSGKYEKERVTQAWRHHAEVSELYRKILDKETEDMASLKEKLRGGSEPEKDNLQCDDSSQDQLKKESSRLDNLVPLKLELVELQQKRCREHSTATLILEQAVNAVETAVQENDNLLVSGDFFQRKSSWASSEEERDNLDPREQDPMVSQYSGEAETNREAASPPKETINSKEALKKALRKILEKLLNEKTADTDPEPDSYTSESDFSELELDGSTKKDGEREDENVVEKVHSQAEPEESHSEARAEVDGNVEDVPDDNQVTPDTKSSVPVIVTLSPRTQNVFEIERFNISRLLRDEYIDRIRSQRRKVRRIKARNNGNNGKLLEQFQEQCDLLLERVNFGESVGRRDEVLPKRQRLTSTPSDDSGIADFADADKDGVVRKYKELLEKARKDLNHAHRALRERPEKINENEINNELREMNRRLKERENDLNEVEVKHAGLENERKELLDRIKSAGPSSNGTGNVGSESGVPEEEPGFHGSLLDQVAQPDDGTRFDVAVAQPVDGTGINVATAGGDLPVRRGSSNDLCSEIPEEKGLDAEANGVDSELDRRRLSKEHEELKLKVDTLEKEIEVKDQEFLELSRSKQEEVNELQRKFIEGTGSEEILDELQKKLSEAIEGKRELEARCSEMEKPIGSGRSNEANGEEKDVMKELERLKNENNVLENKNNEKQEKIEELQLKMLGGSDGEEILKDLQNELRELNEKNKSLEMENRKLMGDDISERAKDQLDNSKAGTIAELKHDNSTLELENQEMSKQLEKLQNDLLKGTGSEDVLEELQKKVKDLNAKNKELEKVCRNCEENEASGDLENTDVKRLEKELEKLGDEKQKLAVDNKNKDDEIGELQRKLVEGSGGEEVLANLQQQMKELKHTNENLEVRCQEMEDLNSELKIDKEENDIEFEFEKEISKLKEENAGLVEKNKSKDNEIRELQKSLVDGSGGEELLQRLQDKIQELEEKQKTLEKRCRELEESNERMEIKEKDLTNENKEMANEVIRTKKENDYLERESKAKTDEILRLQENLLDGTGGEEILKQLQDQVKEKEEMNKELRKKCNEIEAHEQALIEDKEEDEKGTEKELVKLRDENQRLIRDNRDINNEISDLQKKLVEGTGGEDILTNIQDQIKTLKEENKKLEGDCNHLKDENEKLKTDKDKKEKEAVQANRLAEENANLVGENKSKDNEIRELQRKLVDGSGGEEILRNLQDKVKELEGNNKILQDQCRDLDGVIENMEKKETELTNEKREIANEVTRMKKENDYLESENKAKTDEILRLQKNLLDGTGGEEILKQLQHQVKEKEEMNKELRKKCNEIEAHEQALIEDKEEDEKGTEKELVKLRDENQRLIRDNRDINNEISDLQKKLVEGTGGEDILTNIQHQIKTLKEENKKLEGDCDHLKDENEKLKTDKDKKEKEAVQANRLAEENANLVGENKSKDNEIRELQRKLVDGSGGEEILQNLQDKVKELEGNNKILQDQCRDLDGVIENMAKKETELTNENREIANEVIRMKKENDYLERESKAKTDEILRLQENLLDGTGGEEILKQLQEQIKEKEGMNKDLMKKCNEIEAREEALKEIEEKGEKARDKELVKLQDENRRLVRDKRDKDNEISNLQKKLVDGTGGEDVLANIQDQMKTLREKNEKLEADCADLKDENERLGSNDDGTNEEKEEICRLRLKNASLVDENKSKDDEIHELQKALVKGSGAEEVLQALQDKINDETEKRIALEKHCGELTAANRKMAERENDYKDENDKMKEKLSGMKKENDFLEHESQAKSDEISKLQDTLLTGTGAEDILDELRDKIKELEEMNKDLRKRCNEMQVCEDKVKNERSKELSRLEDEVEKITFDNKNKEDEISGLQKKLVEGTGAEDVLEKLQAQLKNLKEKNDELEKDCCDLKERNRRSSDFDQKLQDNTDEISKLRDENERLVNENQAKDDEICDLQQKLVSGMDSEEIVQQLQGKAEMYAKRNKELEKKCKDMENVSESLRNRDYDRTGKGVDEIKKENGDLKRDNEGRTEEVDQLQQDSVKSCGSEDIVQQLQDDGKELKENGEKLNERKVDELKTEDEKLLDDYKLEVAELMKINEELEDDIQKKSQEINRMQKMLVEGTGSEEVLQDLQDQMKELEQRNKQLENTQNYLKNSEEMLKRDDGDGEGKVELDKLRNQMSRLEDDNSRQKDEIFELQQKLVSGTGAEKVLEELQEQLKDSEDKNRNLRTYCDDLQEDNDRLKKDKVKIKDDIRGRPIAYHSENEKELERLRKDVSELKLAKEDKEEEVSRLQRKLLEGTGAEDLLQELQERLKDSEEKIKDLEIECSNLEEARNNLREENKELQEARGKMRSVAVPSRKKKSLEEREMDKKGSKVPPGIFDSLVDNEEEDPGSRKAEAEVSGEFRQKENVIEGGSELEDKDDVSQVRSHDDCLEMIPKIVEERDHWKGKYKALRKKVGESFVDIIPEVCSEETMLEKERDKTLSKLSDVRKEINEEETPLLKTMSENERIQKELREVEDHLEDTNEQLEHIKDLREQERRIKEEQSMLRQCLAGLESSNDDLNDQEQGFVVEHGNKESESGKNETRGKVKKLCEEMDNLLAEEARGSSEKKQGHHHLGVLFDDKIKTKRELRNLEQAIEDLRQSSSGEFSMGERLGSVDRDQLEADLGDNTAIQGELEDIRKEVDELQSSLETSNVATGNELGILVALMKEKSRLDDELSVVDKTLGQLSKRDRENLLKERAKQEKVAKRLLELSREKEVAQSELKEIEALVQTKELELLAYFELESNKEKPPVNYSVKRKVSREGAGGAEENIEDPAGGISSADESIGESLEEEKPLSSEDAVVLSEELGLMIQKKSSLGVRLESLGKEITTQSLKVEKSLLGVKEDPTGGTSPRSSHSSLDDLSQSQLSIFDNLDLIDELSVATGIVRDERIKRKTSRKAPMAKLLKEKAGLEKKVKESDGKILVQNAKIRNALREGKDPGRAQAKFAQALEEREKVEDDLASVLNKIDECKLQSDEFAGKGKLGKRRASTGSMGRLGKPGGKSLSKNDKRRLLSQKKSLEKELDGVKRQIDDYSLEGGDDGLQDFPEMVEVGNVGRTVERLRKLINREALLKQNLEGVASSDEQLGRADGEKVKGNAALYPGVMNVLQAEKEKKEAKLAELEKDIKHERKFTDAAKNKNDLKKRKRALKNDMEITLKELEDEEETLMVELEDLATKRDRTASEKEEILKEEVIALSKQKEKLEKQLGNLQDILQRQVAESDQKREQISEKYQQFAELKNEEEDLGKTLEDINKKLLTRKEWAADSDGQRTSLETQHDNDENNEAESYGEILKRMDEEDLNMADLIRELEATQETLSKEREITGELLDLIKSRVGNELLEALTGDGLPSPSRETAEMSSAGDYQDVASKIEHDSVTVAEIIAEYKKMNEVSVKENQKLANMLDVLKRKVDEDLFTSIVSEEPADCEASKKFELSKILENNQTLFQQIVAKSEPERRMKTNLAEVLEDESKEVKDELNNGENQSKENERIKDKLGNLKREVESITTDLNEVKKEELEEELGDVEELKKENACSKELIQDLKNELESVSSELDEVKKTKEELEMDRNDAKEFKEEISRSKEKIQDLENESESRTRKLDEVEKTKKELEEKIDDVEELKEENARLKRTIQDLKAELESITRELDEVKKTNEETEKGRDDVEELEKEDTCSNDMIQNLQKELESITSELEDANKMNDEMRNKLKSDHGIREENERLKEKLAAFEKEKRDEIFNEIKENNTNDGMESTLSTELERNEDDSKVKPNPDAVEKKNEEMISKFERDQKTRKETKSADETSDGLKCLEELKEENSAMKEMLEVLEKENNEIIPTLEDLKKTKKELEDEVEYLRKENEDLLSVNGKLRENEHEKETMKEELERLKNKKKEIVDYVEKDLQQDATTGVEKALEDYNKQFKDMEKQCDQMRSECESSKELREVIGEKLAEKLLGLSKERRADLEDTLYNPRCIERILTHQVTLAKILEKNEKDLDTMEERLGQELFSCISDQDLGLKEERGERPLKISDQLKDGGKDLTQIVKSYEDLIESQADEINMAETLSQKVEAMEKELETLRNQKGQSKQFDEFCKEESVELGSIEVDQNKMERFQKENLDSSESATPGKSKKWKKDEKPGVIVGDDEDFPENLKDDAGPTASLHEEMNGEQKLHFDPNEKGMLFEQHGSEPPDMELEYQELLKKMIEHQKEIEEAEEMLREQKTQHELEKKELLGHFNNEKNNMQHHIECERKSMEKAMQNLINEIVRLKEERKEIRKTNRIEKEKMEAAFEKERAELYSNNETVKAEIQEKLGKAFSHVSQKEKLMMEQREQELQEELVHLKNERKEMAVKLKDMERKLEDQSSLYKESNLSRDLKQKNAREEIRNEFEDKMRQEKKTFQETLLSLRKEIDRLQQERYEALNKASEEKAAKVHDEETAESSAYRLSVYERLESDFKAKVQSEKASFENRIRELRGEKEELERQKQEIKTAMRKQRLEMTKKHEKEKDELAEKHRNEMKALRNKHRERVKDEQTDNETHSIARSFSDSRNLYELQRTVREKDAKIRRYETFFRELNQEASIFQQDPDIAV